MHVIHAYSPRNSHEEKQEEELKFGWSIRIFQISEQNDFESLREHCRDISKFFQLTVKTGRFNLIEKSRYNPNNLMAQIEPFEE